MGTWLIFIEQLQSFLEEKKVMESFIFVDLFHISLQKTGLVHLFVMTGRILCSGARLWQWFGLIWVRDPETAPCQSVLITPVFLHSYPSVVVVPQSISDDSILRIAKNHRQGRFPVAVWRHQRNKATLLRAGGIERSTIGSIMRQTKNVGQGGVASHAISSSASAEQEKYFSAVGE